MKGDNEHASRHGAMKSKEINALGDWKVVDPDSTSTESRHNVDRSRKLNRKKVGNSNEVFGGHSSVGTSHGSTNNPNGEMAGGTYKRGDASTSGRETHQPSGRTRFGGGNKKRGPKSSGTKILTKRGGTNNRQKISPVIGSDETTGMIAAMKTQQHLSDATNLNSVMNTGGKPSGWDESGWRGSDAPPGGWAKVPDAVVRDYKNAADTSPSSWGSTGGGKPSEWDRSGMYSWNQVPGEVVHKHKVECPCVYVDAPSWRSSWGGPSSGSSWGASSSSSSSAGNAMFPATTPGVGAGTGVGIASGGGGSSWGGPSSGSSSVGNPPLSATTSGTGAGKGVGIASSRGGSSWCGPSLGSSSVGITPYSATMQGMGTGTGSTSGREGSTLGTKSSKKAKSSERKLQWGGAQQLPEKILVCTCVPTYFPTYEPT